MERYETFSTTADVGIRIRGKDIKELYSNAIKGLNLLYFGTEIEESKERDVEPVLHSFTYTGDSPENILVNLLSEVVFLLQCREQITIAITFVQAQEKEINARLHLLPLDRFNLLPELEIKSVTYHDLHVIEKEGEKYTEIVFDI